jgi:hypothetical protein
MSKKVFIALFAAILVLGMTAGVRADTVYWTNWSRISYGTSGSAYGSITFPSSTVDVNYTGEIASRSDRGDYQNFPTTYTDGLVVNNAPPNEPNGTSYTSITLVGGNNSIVNTISFSAPVVNPVMAIQSLGQPGNPAEYDFSSPFTILSSGKGHWNTATNALVSSLDGYKLYGWEGNGTIQFSGVFSSISWTTPDGEDYHMFTVGAPSTSVPEPSVLLLLAPALGGLGVLRKRVKK